MAYAQMAALGAAARASLAALLPIGVCPTPILGQTTTISREDAVARAAAYIGFDNLADLKIQVRQIVPEDDNTPFLHTLINGHLVWTISFGNLRLQAGGTDSINPHIRELNAYLDAESGKLLKVWSTEALDLPRPRSELPPDVAESITLCPWEGLPEEMPKVTLLEALSACMSWSTAIQQLDALYVVNDLWVPDRNEDGRIVGKQVKGPFWNVFTASTTPLHGHVPEGYADEPPFWALRSIIDATTGKGMVFTNDRLR